jgi:hypothetical protein
MASDTNKLAERFLAGYAIVECTPTNCARQLQSSARGHDAPMHLVDTTTDPHDALEYLSLLSWPASRHIACSATQNCTALVNNSRNGSDYADQKVWLARHLHSRLARIVIQTGRTWTRGTDRETLQYAATIFELFDDNGELIRSVACMDDGGRWVFAESGQPHAIEQSFPYGARRKRDRFSSAQLETLVCAYGLPVMNPESFLAAGRYYLFETPSAPVSTCTLAEADDPAFAYYQRGLTWVSHIDTHASSVVADFERCLKLNPDYEPKVRAALDEAHRVLATQQDA